MSPARAAAKDIVRLHVCFEEWFNGRVAKEDAQFEGIKRALPEDFKMIPPSGKHVANPGLLGMLHGLHGSCADRPIAIEIKDIRTVCDAPTHCVMTYEEWQTKPPSEGAAGPEVTARVSTAVFRPGAGDAVEWVHVHETWLPGHAGK